MARSVRERSGRTTAVAYLGPGEWLGADGARRTGSPPDGAVAVAGIGRPDAFFRQVAGAGVETGGRIAFRDHHTYTAADAEQIEARAAGTAVVTTAKDAVKLRRVLPAASLWVLEQKVTFEAGREELVRRLAEVAG